MNKPRNILDYLHFYPKVPIIICEPGIEPICHYLEGLDWCIDKVIAERVNYDPSWIKPILKSLSDITEKDNRYLSFLIPSADSSPVHRIELETERIQYLLGQHYDLFGLIKDGLAVDSMSLSLKNN